MISRLLSTGIKRTPIKRRNLIILPSITVIKRNALLLSYNSTRLFGTLEDKLLKAHYLLDDALKDLSSTATTNSVRVVGGGEEEEAIVEKLKKSLQLYPTAAAHYNLGNVLFSLKQFQQAKHNWEESIKISSLSNVDDDIKVDALVNLGNLELLVENNTKEAINLFKQALSIKVKDDGELRFNLGVALDKNGQLSEAIKEYERSVELLSKDSEKVKHVEMVLRNAKIRNHLNSRNE